ncbi:hypothetical protein [Paraburkholderia sp. J69-2]|uniref:hypothetical protein n=1 Tax=Paraburkholderia sp. J69-2 TaxID=2805437 RepID=UPI002AAFB089|nr:hypothetical protein [Paraburkholderia sp. J69-2]
MTLTAALASIIVSSPDIVRGFFVPTSRVPGERIQSLPDGSTRNHDETFQTQWKAPIRNTAAFIE